MSAVSANSSLAMKLGSFLPLSAPELRCLAGIQSAPMVVKRGRQLIDVGECTRKVYVLQKGWAYSYKDTRSGGRQIISFPIAGDWLGLRSVLLRTADYSVTTLTDVVVSTVEVSDLLKCLNEFPRLAAAILWAASRDEAIVVEHLVNIGRRSAVERTAHFFMELEERLNLIGLSSRSEFGFPLSQFVMADALGLTAIHVNRVLRQLREQDLLTVQKGRVQIHDFGRLRQLAGFEGGYLNPREDLPHLDRIAV